MHSSSFLIPACEKDWLLGVQPITQVHDGDYLTKKTVNMGGGEGEEADFVSRPAGVSVSSDRLKTQFAYLISEVRLHSE
jgi:hypothetical protein